MKGKRKLGVSRKVRQNRCSKNSKNMFIASPLPQSNDNETLEPTESNHNPNPLQSADFEHNLRILFCNIDGLRNKAKKLKILSANDHIICMNETNLVDTDSSLISQLGLGDTVVSKSLHNYTFKKGRRVLLNKGKNCSKHKKKGFGTTICSRIPAMTTLHPSSADHELVYSILSLNNCTGLVINGYRSPSSKFEPDIDSFYDAIDHILTEVSRSNNLDFAIFVGDDNASSKSSCSYSRKAAATMVRVAEKHQMVDLLCDIKTRGDHQPDSCYGFFDSEKVDIKVSTLNGIDKSDHDMLQIQVSKSKLIAALPKYKTAHRKTQIVSDEKMAELLDDHLVDWHAKNHAKLANATEKETDKVTRSLVDAINKVKSICYRTKRIKVPAATCSGDTALDLQILHLRSKISKYAWQIKQAGGKHIEARKKLVLANAHLKRIVDKAAKVQFQEDMQRQVNAERKNLKKFWDISGAFLNKSAYQTSIERDLSIDEINLKLDQVDKTFINQDPSYSPNYECYENAPTPLSKYELLVNISDISERIKKIKKLQPFYRNNADTLAPHISLILQFIQKTDHFPQVLKTSRCTIIGKAPKERAIFALSPLPKIVETMIKLAFDELKVEDGTIQMAYTKDRGTTACNGITLQEVELSDEPCVQTQQDLKKAFNSTKHETIITEAQSKFGAGKLISSWLKGRSYTFETSLVQQIRGSKANQGVPAGTLIGVECFLLFIATATSLTNKNVELLWAALYADDTSPLIKVSNQIEFQKALDFAVQWAKANNIEFHTTGAKAPSFLAYLKKDHNLPQSIKSLSFDGNLIKQIDQDKILGLTRKVRPLNPNSKASKIIDKFGYECEWDLTKLKQIAYRFQNLKNELVPEFAKKLVSSYFVGYLRFSSSIIFLRCSQKHLKEVRFYYCMAMAACIGLTTAEALNLSCCKHQSVSDDNSAYKLLLEKTGLPSIREMAALDSVSLIKQVSKLKPEWFVLSSTRSSRSQPDGKPRIIGVSQKCRGTLMESLLSLRDEYNLNFGMKRAKITKLKDKIREEFKIKLASVPEGKHKNKALNKLYNERKAKISSLDTPILEEYFIARDLCTDRGAVNFSTLMRTVTLNSRYHFQCLDTADRLQNFKTPQRSEISQFSLNSLSSQSSCTTPRANRKKRASSETLNRAAKRSRSILDCEIWNGNVATCKFCLDILDTTGGNHSTKNFESHLLKFCTGIPGKGPLSNKEIRHPRDRMRRLAEIAAVPDPGGL